MKTAIRRFIRQRFTLFFVYVPWPHPDRHAARHGMTVALCMN